MSRLVVAGLAFVPLIALAGDVDGFLDGKQKILWVSLGKSIRVNHRGSRRKLQSRTG